MTTNVNQAPATVLYPGDAGFDTATAGFQTTRPHRPDVVVRPGDTSGVAAAVRWAADRGLAVAAQSTGHGRASVLAGGMLICTDRLRGVTVDPATRTARMDAGARWSDVAAAAAEHDLAPLSGSSPQVGVVGYLLGGGFGVLSRRYGYAADLVREVEAVDSDGTAVRRDGFVPGDVVTTVVTALLPITELWGGCLAVEATPDVLADWLAWTRDLPEDVTSSVALVPFPDSPDIPPMFRGRQVAMIRVAAALDADRAEALLEPLRDTLHAGPVLFERLGVLPYTEAHTIYSDPTDPHAYLGDARLLSEVDAAALRDVPALAGPSVVELRHLGGAMARSVRAPDAAHRDARYVLRAVTMIDPVAEAGARTAHDRLFAGFADRDLGRAWTFAYGLRTERTLS